GIQLATQLVQLRGTMVTFGDVLFDLDKSDLKPGAMRNIQQLAEFLQQNPERQVIVEGYTDSTGSANYNQRLSER
ncbi:OmpA family protein, partial [Klebsiella pneumoniae]|uniref:OmpA family protein n=1 Tax=Klebsiella pneumoniae TaxID=573 RepID=UPI0013CF8976